MTRRPTSHWSGLPASLLVVNIVWFLSGCRLRAGSRSITALGVSAPLVYKTNLR